MLVKFYVSVVLLCVSMLHVHKLHTKKHTACLQMIDEFTDVNKGEKELMKLWNLFTMENK